MFWVRRGGLSESRSTARAAEITAGDYVEYAWDHHNRLTTVTFRDDLDAKLKEVHYTYDVFGRLIHKEVDTDGDDDIDRSESYVYDGQDVVLVFDESSSLTSRYLHGPAVDQVFAQEDGSGDILWGLADNQGTIRDVVDYDATSDTTSVDNHVKFDAYGNITAESDSNVDFRYGFAGYYFDEDTELHLGDGRWYDGGTGRLLSENKGGASAGESNATRFAQNNPTNIVEKATKAKRLPKPMVNPRPLKEQRLMEQNIRIIAGLPRDDRLPLIPHLANIQILNLNLRALDQGWDLLYREVIDLENKRVQAPGDKALIKEKHRFMSALEDQKDITKRIKENALTTLNALVYEALKRRRARNLDKLKKAEEELNKLLKERKKLKQKNPSSDSDLSLNSPVNHILSFTSDAI